MMESSTTSSRLKKDLYLLFIVLLPVSEYIILSIVNLSSRKSHAYLNKGMHLVSLL
jgi:hypothetical protein